MSKAALVINALDRFKPMSAWAPFMVDRAICEQDNSTLQILPYISLIDEDGNLFAYTRGHAGQEARLHNKKSIGLGGHIDHPVTTTLEDLIVTEAIRELREEVGYSPSEDDVRKALKSSIVLYEPLTEVDAVHIAVAMVLQVKRSDLVTLEEGVILNPEWLNTNYLAMHSTIRQFVKPECMQWVFETWSQRFLEINATNESFLAQHQKQQAESDAFKYASNLVDLWSHFSSENKNAFNMRLSPENPCVVEYSSLDLVWKKLNVPIAALWKVIDIDNDGKITLSEGTSDGALIVTKDFVLWDVVNSGNDKVAS